MFVAGLHALSPGLVENVVYVLDVLVAPHLSVTELERLESVVAVAERQVVTLEHVGEEVLIGELERGDLGIVVERVHNASKRFGRGAQDDETRVEEVVCRLGELGGGDGDGELGEGVTTVLGNP